MERTGVEKLYRIGDFARHLGVTPDFLKHYEQFRLVDSVPSKSGYRYYPFIQSYKLLEAMSLRGYGLPLKEIDTLLNDKDLPAIKEALDAQAVELRREMLFQQAVLEDHQHFSAWMERMIQRKTNWHVEDQGPYYFLPHSHQHDFLADSRIYELLNAWMKWMPIVKFCAEIPRCFNNTLDRVQADQEHFWGLMISQLLAQRHGLPINGAVRTIPHRKWFFFDFALPIPPDETLHPLFPINTMLEQLASLGLTPSGTIYEVLLLHTHINKLQPMHCGYFMVPID